MQLGNLLRRRSMFPHPRISRDSFIHAVSLHGLGRLCAGPNFRIVISHPLRRMPISFADSDRFEDYWALRRNASMVPTGELPTEIRGPDAERLCDKVFTRDISKLKPGRCAYGIACYPDGGLIVDGILTRIEIDHFWYVQAEGQIYSWLIAHAQGLDVQISDPGVWVNQVQGPRALEMLEAACDGGAPEPFRYFGIADVTMGGQRVLVTRTGWTGEIGWEYYTFFDTDCRALWTHLMEAGKPAGMIHADLDSMDIRRIEAAIRFCIAPISVNTRVRDT